MAHTDKPQPHVHVVVNRVHPRDGRMLSSSFEKLKASRWAQKYEEERGKVYCVERVLNNAARDRGEYRRGAKDEPRGTHELGQADDVQAAQQAREEHRRRCATLKESERRLTRMAAERMAAVEKRFIEQKAKLVGETRRVAAVRRERVRESYRQKWRVLYHDQDAERRLYDKNERRVLGRVQNALRGISGDSDGRRRRLSKVFGLLVDAGARREALRRRQESERNDLGRRQRKIERLVARRTRRQGRQRLSKLRRQMIAERNDTVLKTRMERAKLRARWRESGQALRARLRELGIVVGRRGAPELTPTKASDLLPARGAEGAARRVDQWRELRASRSERALKKEDPRER